MAQHNELGKAGEERAVAYLESQGYQVRHRNWRRGHLELDIVAVKGNELIIIEVKTRRDTDFGLPEEAVNWKKIRHTVRAADAYVRYFQLDEAVRFDIITLVGKPENFEIEHLINAFQPPLF